MARSSSNIERKVLQEDTLTNWVSRAFDYAALHRNLVFGIVGGVLAAALLGIMWTRDTRAKASASGDELSQVVMGFGNGQFDQALVAASNVQTNHPGTEAATLAKYLAGACQLRLGRYAEAEQSMKSYLAESAKAPFYEQAARMGLAASLMAQGRAAEAAPIYQEEAAKLPEALATQAKLDAARAWVAAGSPDQAKPILEALSTGTDAVARQAKIELAVLGSAKR